MGGVQVKLWEHMLDAAVHRAPPGAERDSIRMPLSETEDAAIAHLVSGVRNCRPGRVTVAEKLLRQVAENAATAPAEELVRLSPPPVTAALSSRTPDDHG